MSKKPAKSAATRATATASTTRQGVTGDGFFGWDGDTLVVNVLGKPSAGKDAIGTPLGKELRISVTAAPENGKATDHMVRFLAPLFGVRPSQIEVVFGRESVHKQLRIHAPSKMPAVFGQALEAKAGKTA
ncbi:DUF167 domain-containing protein [Curvibacter sp. CHRR-16]|uniref:DUF167 domain-containing protein n=1 Tax=Curvibacter sp. CHRR-16 TaxID=2835872 RepID=UPI001BDA6B75|nr:DUF167 domain-containing protein [Curvibacter sp. CHRR-16]MBT0569856.1 DUF167 domain-containing protein [Curvibacter sp. CHRR-16]